MVLSSFLALYLCLKSPCNSSGQSHPKLSIFWAKVTPSLGSQTPQNIKFPYFSWFRTFKFPEITLFKSSKQLRQNVKCFVIIISMFKITF